MITASFLLLAGALCGVDAQRLLWNTASTDPADEARVVVTLSNFDSFRAAANQRAFLDVLEDVVSTGGDLNASTVARIAGRVGVTTEAVEEYFEAVNYYRHGGVVVRGILVQANPGATRNALRIAGAASVETAVAEMLEIVAARRLGYAPAEIRSFGEKIDITRFGLGVDTIEADIFKVDLTFHDAKWTHHPDQELKTAQIRNLTTILSDRAPPISHVMFPTVVPPTPATQALVDDANRAIRLAHGLAGNSPEVFIEIRPVGPFQ